MDIVNKETRSKMMASVRSKNTVPERLIRSSLYKKGYRFRIHDKRYAGKPDIVLPKYHSVIFINGCFWHGHENCKLFRIPKTRQDFWSTKITHNRENDMRNCKLLLESNWRVCIIWECAIKGKKQLANLDQIVEILENWLISADNFLEIRHPER